MRQFRMYFVACFVASLMAVSSTATAQPQLHRIENQPSDLFSEVFAVCEDGTTVAGYAVQPGSLTRAISWTPSSGAQYIPDEFGRFMIRAYGISPDGLVHVGFGQQLGGQESQAFAWTAAEGLNPLPQLQPGSQPIAKGVINGGGTIVGLYNSPSGLRGFRWTSSAGMQLLSAFPGKIRCAANAISASGDRIVGWAESDNDDHPAIWSGTDGPVDLGVLPGFLGGTAEDISSDGTAVAGWDYVLNSNSVSWRWTQQSGKVSLGVVPQFSSPRAYAMSGNGTVIAGSMKDSLQRNRAFLWSTSLGMVELNDYVQSLGVNTAGWDLEVVRGIDADGTTLVGTGTYNSLLRGWVITGLPTPCVRILASPQDQEVCRSDAASFSVSASSTQQMSFRWQREAEPGVFVDLANGSTFSWDGNVGAGFVFGAATPNLVIAANTAGGLLLSAPHAISYRCRVSNACGAMTSSPARLWLIGESPAPCDNVDFNNDCSAFDPIDIDAFLSVYSEGPCIPETATCNDADFNNDGSVFDPCDIDSFLSVYSEGPCDACGQ